MRQNDGTELFKKITALELYRPIVGAGAHEAILTEALDEEEVAYSVDAAGTLVNGDPVILAGSGGVELNHLTANLAALEATVKYKTEFAHDAGARLIRCEKVNLGKIEEGGLSINASQQVTEINSAQDDAPVAFMQAPSQIDVSFGLLGHNIENMLLWLGQQEKVRGAGTAADPHQGSWGGLNRQIAGIVVVRGTGVRHDGKLFHYDFCNMSIAPAGTKAMARNAASAYPCSGRITQMIKRIWAA